MVSVCILVREKSVILVTYLHFFFHGSFAWWEGPIQGKGRVGHIGDMDSIHSHHQTTWYCAVKREYVVCVCVKSCCVSAPMGPWEHVLSQQPADNLIESALLGTNWDLLSFPLFWVKTVQCLYVYLKGASLYGQTFPVFVFFLCFLPWAWCDLVVSHRYLQARHASQTVSFLFVNNQLP